MLKRQLTLRDGIGLGLGSIIGSGILFLPSLTYSVAGADVLVSWVVTTIMCIPLLYVFSKMVTSVPNESGMEGYVNLGLGQHVASSIPILFLSTVGIGMPSAALIAGEYVKQFAGGASGAALLTAVILFTIAIGANILGVKTGSAFQRIVAFGLFFLGLLLFALTLPKALPTYHELTPVWRIKPIISGCVIAFWAYAGFENMTFMAGEFERPKRDLIGAIVISLILCGALYFGLTANFAALIPHDKIDKIAGLYQLAGFIEPQSLAKLLVTAFAFGAVLINLTSWSWGISRLLYSSANKGQLPRFLSKLSDSGVPKRSLIFLLVLFLTVVGLETAFPALLEKGLVIVSTNFVFLYFLAVLSFLASTKTWVARLLGFILLLALGYGLTSAGWLIIYPVSIFLISLLISYKKGVR